MTNTNIKNQDQKPKNWFYNQIRNRDLDAENLPKRNRRVSLFSLITMIRD